MCFSCWTDYGSPQLDTPGVREMARRLRAADPFGALHIVVDDMNLEDDAILYCRDEVGSASASEIKLCDDLLAMSLDERASAAGLEQGCWSIQGFKAE